ncbi:MAG: hypothetical protein MJE68_13475 [Proteobacteria bacterium]|nr:hypothetical protein [Pseudomonadota bacterium]
MKRLLTALLGFIAVLAVAGATHAQDEVKPFTGAQLACLSRHDGFFDAHEDYLKKFNREVRRVKEGERGIRHLIKIEKEYLEYAEGTGCVTARELISNTMFHTPENFGDLTVNEYLEFLGWEE